MNNTRAPHSYRHDTEVPAFDDTRPLVIFDGHCVLCSSGVQWMMKYDPHGDTVFAAIQEPIPQALYRHYGLDAEAFDTFMVLADGAPYLRWQGVTKAARLMPAPWRWFGNLGRLVPSFVGDAVYDWVQRNRIDWFGARDICFAPDEASRIRFLPDANTPN